MKSSARAAAARKKMSRRIAWYSISRIPPAVERWPEMWSMWNAPSDRDYYGQFGDPSDGEEEEDQAWVEQEIEEEFERSGLPADFEIEAPEAELPECKPVVSERA